MYRTALIKESNSKGLSTSYIRGADIASFGKLRHFGMEYGDGKKQELNLRMLQVIEEKKEETVQRVLQKYPQHNLLSKDFEIQLFNNSNRDEYSLIVAFRGQITDQNETMIAQINKEISGEISRVLIQNLTAFPINSFTSPVPLEDDTNFARSPLLIRIEEEFCNCPYIIYELEKNHFPRISSFLALKSLNFKTSFLNEARAIWLSLSSENQVFNHKDFDINVINYIQENFDIGIDSLKLKSEFVEQKKRDGEEAETAAFKIKKNEEAEKKMELEYQKYQNSPFFGHLLTEIQNTVSQISDKEIANNLLKKFLGYLQNLELANFPVGFDNFSHINFTTFDIFCREMTKLIPGSKFVELVYYLKANIRHHNNATESENGGHPAIDEALREMLTKMLEFFDTGNVQELLKIYGNELIKNPNTGQFAKTTVCEIIKKSAAELPLISNLIRNSIITTNHGPCILVTINQNYLLQLDNLERSGQITKFQKTRCTVLCRFLLEKIGKSLTQITEVEVKISEGENLTSFMPVAVESLNYQNSITETAETLDQLCKTKLNTQYINNLLTLNSADFGQKMRQLYGFLVDFGKTSVYELQDNTWADTLLGSLCDPKRGIMECTRFLVDLIAITSQDEHNQIIQNPNLSGIVEMVRQIFEKLVKSEEEKITQNQNKLSQNDQDSLKTLNYKMKKDFMAKIKELQNLGVRITDNSLENPPKEVSKLTDSKPNFSTPSNSPNRLVHA